jgi:hypothetical protein
MKKTVKELLAYRCLPGCPCGKHQLGKTAVYKRTLQHRFEAQARARPDVAEANSQRPPVTVSQAVHLSAVRTAWWQANPEARRNRPFGRTRGSGNFGDVGVLYASILLPAGYVQHHIHHVGPGQYDRYEMDFAHLEAKVNIELDGPYHDYHERDDVRDRHLRSLGWKVIRIDHV